uniref:Uncharacterized protein n=1 Tax=Ditylenchus dipsaci TaxID=166011 RepID=A0A915ERR7_9BILA
MNISTQTDSLAFTKEVSIQTGNDQPVIGKWKGFDPADDDWYCGQVVDDEYRCEQVNYNGTHCFHCHHKRVFTAEEEQKRRQNDLIGQTKGYQAVIFGEYSPKHTFSTLSSYEEFLRQYKEAVTQVVSINSQQYLLVAITTAGEKDFSKESFFDNFKISLNTICLICRWKISQRKYCRSSLELIEIVQFNCLIIFCLM